MSQYHSNNNSINYNNNFNKLKRGCRVYNNNRILLLMIMMIFIIVKVTLLMNKKQKTSMLIILLSSSNNNNSKTIKLILIKMKFKVKLVMNKMTMTKIKQIKINKSMLICKNRIIKNNNQMTITTSSRKITIQICKIKMLLMRKMMMVMQNCYSQI